MKWFKHYTDNHRGKSVQFLFDKFGHLGVSSYYILIEMCAEKLEQKSNETRTDVGEVFGFHQRVVRQNLRTTPTRVRELLECCQTLGLLTFEFTQDLIEIKMPILLNLLDRDQKKPRTVRVTSANQPRLDKEEDKEEDKIKKKNIVLRSKVDDKHTNTEIKNAYIDAYRLRYGIEPQAKGPKFNGQISSFRKNFGVDECISIINFYLTHNDGIYLKASHSIGLCILHADSLRSQMLRGKAITSTMVKAVEKKIESQERSEQISNMWEK